MYKALKFSLQLHGIDGMLWFQRRWTYHDVCTHSDFVA